MCLLIIACGMLGVRRFPPSDREGHVTRNVVAWGVQRVHCRERIQSTALIRRMQAHLNVCESNGCNLYSAIEFYVYYLTLSSINIRFCFLFPLPVRAWNNQFFLLLKRRKNVCCDKNIAQYAVISHRYDKWWWVKGLSGQTCIAAYSLNSLEGISL